MPLGVGRRFRTRSPRIRAAWAEGGREKHYCGASSSREGSEAARGRTGLTGSMLWIFFGKCSLLRINQRYRYLFFLGTPVGGGAPAPRLRRLQMLQRRGGTTLVIISMYTVCMWGGRWPGSRASDGRSRAPDVPAWAGPPAWASSGRAPPRSPEPPFALLSFGIFGDAEHFSAKRSVVVPLHSNLCTGGAGGVRLVYPSSSWSRGVGLRKVPPLLSLLQPLHLLQPTRFCDAGPATHTKFPSRELCARRPSA